MRSRACQDGLSEGEFRDRLAGLTTARTVWEPFSSIPAPPSLTPSPKSSFSEGASPRRLRQAARHLACAQRNISSSNLSASRRETGALPFRNSRRRIVSTHLWPGLLRGDH